MVSEISILIPVFNQDVSALVYTLQAQCKRLPLRYEIRLYDDDSEKKFKRINRHLKKLKYVVYEEMPHNLGRASIRNKLAQESKYPSLLFLDNDCIPVATDFLLKYLQVGHRSEVVVGGTAYVSKTPDRNYRLHWKYGRLRGARPAFERQSRPYRDIYLCNALVSKEIMLKYPLKESLKRYGHEDTLFACYLKRHEINVAHIENPVVHLGLEQVPIMLEKTEQALSNLVELYYEGERLDEIKLVRATEMIRNINLQKVFTLLVSRFEFFILYNLRSSHPNLVLYDLYRLNLLLKKFQQHHTLSKRVVNEPMPMLAT